MGTKKGPETVEIFPRAKMRAKKATTLSMSVLDLLRRVKWRCETQCLRMIKRPKLASGRVLLHHQFGDLISEFLLLYRHILQHILMISMTSMMKRKTLAELKKKRKRKIYYHIIHI